MIKAILGELTAHTGGAFLCLFFAAALEVFGDSCFQSGLHRNTGLGRILPSVAGGVTLILYGVIVNVAPWKFGRLLGIYVVFFFIVAQIVAWARFDEVPTPPILIGGLFLIVGGAIVCWGR
jgi:small multidrug resistance family-3 protein